MTIGDALAGGDVHLAWRIWSTSAESAFASAFEIAGGPVPPCGLALGSWVARFRVSNIGKRVGRFRPDLDDLSSATEVHLKRSCSIPPLLTLKRRSRVVACLLLSFARDGFTLARGLELNNQWSCIVQHGPVGCLDWAWLVSAPSPGLAEFSARVEAAIGCITEFVQRVVIPRRDFAIRVWRSWVWEDLLVHPYGFALIWCRLLRFSIVIRKIRLMVLLS